MSRSNSSEILISFLSFLSIVQSVPLTLEWYKMVPLLLYSPSCPVFSVYARLSSSLASFFRGGGEIFSINRFKPLTINPSLQTACPVFSGRGKGEIIISFLQGNKGRYILFLQGNND
jgi:hypothetical protein